MFVLSGVSRKYRRIFFATECMKTFLNPEDRQEIFERIHALTPDARRRWGTMTPHQMVCHLVDSTRVALGIRKVQPLGNVLTHTCLFRTMALAPLPWPRGILKTAPEINPQIAGTKPREFRSDISELVQLLEEFVREQQRTSWPDHPILGRFSREDWGVQIYKHCDHHLTQFSV